MPIYSVVATKEINYAVVAFFNLHFKVLLFKRVGLLPVHVVGTSQRIECTVHNHNSFSKCPPYA